MKALQDCQRPYIKRDRASKYLSGLLHASRTSRVVAVVNVYALALEDKGPDAILGAYQQTVRLHIRWFLTYLANGHLLERSYRHCVRCGDEFVTLDLITARAYRGQSTLSRNFGSKLQELCTNPYAT